MAFKKTCAAALILSGMAGGAMAEPPKPKAVAVPPNAVAAPPKAVTEPPKAGTIFDDWTVECETVDKTQKCFVSQTQTIKESNSRLIKISIGYLGPKAEPTMIALLPLGIWLPSGAAFKIGDTAQETMVIQQCTGQGCLAAAQLKPDHLKALAEGKSLGFGILPAGKKETLVIGVSAKGLDKGLAAIK